MVLPLIQVKRIKSLPGSGPCREKDFTSAAINVMRIVKAVPWNFKLKTKSGKICQMEGSKIWIDFGDDDMEVYHILGTVPISRRQDRGLHWVLIRSCIL